MADVSIRAVAEDGGTRRRNITPWSTPTALSMALVATVGAMAFSAITHGFTAMTSEAARRAAVLESPVIVPQLLGTDQLGRARSMLADQGHAGPIPRITIVGFVSTRCESLCSVLGSSFEQLQAEIRERHLEDRIRLMTVSFDPAHDTPAALASYAERMHVDPGVWTLLSPSRPERLPLVLAAFGVVVVPLPFGHFQHNAAFQLLDARGPTGAHR